jgi:hypothetical protein
MDHHVRALGWAYIVYGAISGFLSLVTVIFFGGLTDAWVWAEASGGFGPVLIWVLVFHLALAVPMTAGGFFLLRLEEWARMMMIVVSALNILNVPFGSALGVYGLWVLMTPETEPLFLDAVFKSPTGGRRRDPRSSQPPSAARRTAAKHAAPSIKDARANLPE